jgi:asparagine synthase (glutamine-hydrolysing)
MCGIAGVLFTDGRPVDREVIERMSLALRHRGPDGEGRYRDEGTPSVGLASRRLAVIDVALGAQPMSTDDGHFTIVYNGEVFNADELREELIAHGHRFRTRCDTEVILRGWAQWGAQVQERLNGMWAFAIWDSSARRLFLSRDRLGVKPLVYARVADGVLFGSEIKALLASGLIGRSLDLSVIPYYLSSFTAPEPHTFFGGIERLRAGHYLEIDRNGVSDRQYWDCAFEEQPDLGFAECRHQVASLVDDSVRRRLVSDVPLGVFLSGGVDSGLVAGLAARALQAPLRAFTIGFEGADSEVLEAAETARLLGARHTTALVGAGEAARALPELLAAHDEPTQSLLQGHFISRLARQDVTVALTGVGGDELFSSYPTHRVVDLLARLDRVPGWLRGPLVEILHVLSPRRGARLKALLAMPPDSRVTDHLLHQNTGELRRSLVHPALRGELDLDAPSRHLEWHYARARARHPLNRLLYVYVKTYLVDELLRTLDSMSMLHSLETRVPLLDYRLVEAAARMPASHKMSLRQGKVLLRSVADDVNPRNPATTVKRGFVLPLNVWLRGDLEEALRDQLSSAVVRRRGLFDPMAVSSLLQGYLDGDARQAQAVMMLFSFELWAQRVLDAAAPTAWSAPLTVSTDVPALSVIVVNWNTRDILRDCLASVRRHLAGIRAEVIVVDNASADGSAEMVAQEFPEVRLLRNAENLGFARANNQAMRVARGRWFLLLNSDAQLVDESVASLFRRVEGETGLGVAHCRLVMGDGRLQHSTYRFPTLGLAVLEDLGLYKLLSRERRGRVLLAGYWDHGEERDVDWVSGAFMLLPRRVFESTRGFSEAFFMYGEDMEWCYRIRESGYSIRYFPEATVIHLDHSSSAIRWGDKRIAICIERQLQIYASRAGVARALTFHLIKTVGALLRSIYFAGRCLFRLGGSEYDQAMRRYHWLSLRVHAALAVGRR